MKPIILEPQRKYVNKAGLLEQLGTIDDARMSHRPIAPPYQRARTMADTRLRGRYYPKLTLCEVGESESDDNGRNGALSDINDLAHVDGNLAVRGLRHYDGTVGASRRVWVSGNKS